MEYLQYLLDFALHADQHLIWLTSTYGTWTYAILFAIVLCETGLVVTPFLPGDSLLFAVGAVAASGSLDVHTIVALLIVAAVAGDSLNYAVGRRAGPRAFHARSRLLKPEHLQQTQAFYDRHGGKTIVLARFLPIVRTFAPFVAGVGRMRFDRFVVYNVAGGVAWVLLFVYGGYLFGNLPIVRENFSLVVLGIIGVSVVPIVSAMMRRRAAARRRSIAADLPSHGEPAAGPSLS